MTLMNILISLALCGSASPKFLVNLSNILGYNPVEQDCSGACMLSFKCWYMGGEQGGTCSGMFQVCCNINRDSRQFDDHGFKNISLQGIEVTNEKECGKVKIAKRRIVGGSDAGFGSFPWMALVTGGSARCGGALIRPKWVVTAGHCTASTKLAFNYRVYLGEYQLYQNSEPLPRQKFFVSKVIVHPNYEFTPQADRFDVALLELERPTDLHPHILPVCLPLPDMLTGAGVRGFVAGWGATNPDSAQRPKVLQSVEVVTIDNKECENWHASAGIRLRLSDEMMCAGHREGGKDACQGDSGGPLVSQVDGRWYLLGVVSAGYSCAKSGQPGIYHRVTETARWISHVSMKN